jgi:hypothetical protein
MTKNKKPKEKVPGLEQGLVLAMSSLDAQITRAMQRSPEEREIHGTQKHNIFSEKVEKVCSIVLDFVESDESNLDSLLICAQAFTKSLYLLVEELGEQGLGEVRSGYCLSALEKIQRDTDKAIRELSAAVLN